MQCRSHAAQLGRLYDEFKSADVEILLILGDSLDKARRYADSLHLPFPVLSDPDRSVYHLYGLEKVALVIQRTASIFIDCSGVIRYLKTTTNPLIWLQEAGQVTQAIKSLAAPC
ncbi:MAG: peroxiredoxin family protein [Acidobacteriaceae bacterium]